MRSLREALVRALSDLQDLGIAHAIIGGLAVIGHLIALKLLAKSDDRPQDSADLVRLAEVATVKDKAQAREAVRLINERGYSRGRDPEGALNELLG